MTKQEQIKYARDIISRCKEHFGEERVEKALSVNVRINDLENYLQKRSELK